MNGERDWSACDGGCWVSIRLNLALATACTDCIGGIRGEGQAVWLLLRGGIRAPVNVFLPAVCPRLQSYVVVSIYSRSGIDYSVLVTSPFYTRVRFAMDTIAQESDRIQIRTSQRNGKRDQPATS